MARKDFRGAVDGQEILPDLTTINIETASQKRRKWWGQISNLQMLQFATVLMLVFVPQTGVACMLFSLVLYFMSCGKRSVLPLKKPIQSGEIDPRETIGGKARKAGGIFYLGNDILTGEEVWLTNSDARQHFTVIGTTGAGKTETLIGYGANALSWGSGFIYVDGKGDVSLFAKTFVMLRKLGLEDNLLIMNFMNSSLPGQTGYRRKSSNTTNPFASGSAADLTQMVASLMDDAGGDGATWKSRAIDMLTGEMDALCWLRDRGIIELDAGVISDFMTLEKLMELASPDNYPDMPPKIRKGVQTYLNSINVDMRKKAMDQEKVPKDQHTYLLMQFQKVLGTLVKVYGYIFETQYGEVDMYDVVLNRRVLIIMLPALGKAMEEIIALGKIVVATMKGMMAATLGSVVEGSWDQVVENRVTTSNSPVVVVFDEVGYYLVPGMDLIAAQARGCGFCLIYASQDLDSMGRIDQKIANAVIGNTSTKFFMKIEDPNSTADLAIKRGGKITRARAQTFDRRDPSKDQFFMGDTSSYEDISRVDMIDLVSQGAGEGHLTHLGQLIRMRAFYAAPERTVDLKKIRLSANYFIPVPRPSPTDLQINIRSPQILAQLLADDQISKMKEASREALQNMQGYREEDLRTSDDPEDQSDDGQDESSSFMRDDILDLACAVNPEGGTGRPLIEIACSAIAYMVMKRDEAFGAPDETAVAAPPVASGDWTSAGRSSRGMGSYDRQTSRGYGDMPPRRGGMGTDHYSPPPSFDTWETAADTAKPNTPHEATVDEKHIPFDDGSKLTANPSIMQGLADANRIGELLRDDDQEDKEEAAAETSQSGDVTGVPENPDEDLAWGGTSAATEEGAETNSDGGSSMLDDLFSSEQGASDLGEAPGESEGEIEDHPSASGAAEYPPPEEEDEDTGFSESDTYQEEYEPESDEDQAEDGERVASSEEATSKDTGASEEDPASEHQGTDSPAQPSTPAGKEPIVKVEQKKTEEQVEVTANAEGGMLSLFGDDDDE